ncbi:GNAT family N-acetyltransferase [Nocardioides sp.]|uniref:GNAT family N-acetyltransferase n=1 Tax=Nocardioides sp. TaxID=35761 RepID=UPI0027370454|nr:GNAT family N-acetyltransferase [Nocardioides sp.]MDP3892218.1 GNAT family N-acetyltransferase [Nocardioides sp.]
MEIELRGVTEADVPAWNRMLAEVEAVDDTGEEYNEADLLEELEDDEIDPVHDRVGAFEGDRMVGIFSVMSRPATDELHTLWLFGAVTPDRRQQGLGSMLVARMLERARQVHRERHPEVPAAYQLTGGPDNADQERLLADHGFTPWRYEFGMRASTRRLPERPALPDGLELRTLDIATDSARLLGAHNDVFVDLPGFAPWSEQMWQQYAVGSRNSRHHVSFLVTDPARDDTIVAYLMTSEYDAYTEASGLREAWVSRLGTRREYRGRGVAQALLAHALHAFAADGFDEAALSVDTENPTGALGVYERCGFEMERRFTIHRLVE